MRDYEGNDEMQAVQTEVDKSDVNDCDPDAQMVDHVLDRLVTMLMMPAGGNGDADFIREDCTVTEEEVNYESLLMQKIRLSGQAKSVRCLSSHIRQTSIKLRDKSKGMEADRGNHHGGILHSCASNGDPTRAISNERCV